MTGYDVVVRGAPSSKRSSTTVFGSGWVDCQPDDDVGLLTDPCVDWTLGRRPPASIADAYSGRLEKLSGVATTAKVPGRCVCAFLSRSSSLVSVAKAGRLSQGLGAGPEAESRCASAG